MNASSLKKNAPVIAFALCVVCGWIVSYFRNDWILGCIGIIAGIIVGDLFAAIFRPPETPSRKRTDKPR